MRVPIGTTAARNAITSNCRDAAWANHAAAMMTASDIAPSGDDSPHRAAQTAMVHRRSRCSASIAMVPNITAGTNVSRPPHRFTPHPQANSTTPTTGSGRAGLELCHRSTTSAKHQVATSTEMIATGTTPNTLPSNGATTP